MPTALKFVTQTTHYEVEEGTWPNYGLLTVTRAWIEKIIVRMDTIAALQSADSDLRRIIYTDGRMDYFNDAEEAGESVVEGLNFGTWREPVAFVAVGEDFEMPENNEVEGEQYGEVLCDVYQIVVDEDSLFFRAMEHNTDWHFAAPEISKKQLLEWHAQLSD